MFVSLALHAVLDSLSAARSRYIKHQEELIEVAMPDEKVIINTFLSLKKGGTVDFIPMSETLFAWSKKWIDKNS